MLAFAVAVARRPLDAEAGTDVFACCATGLGAACCCVRGCAMRAMGKGADAPFC